jgi:hypothetical protein
MYSSVGPFFYPGLFYGIFLTGSGVSIPRCLSKTDSEIINFSEIYSYFVNLSKQLRVVHGSGSLRLNSAGSGSADLIIK